MATSYPNCSRSPESTSGELQRLHALVPPEWQNAIELSASGSAQLEPIQCVEGMGNRVRLQIDRPQWESLPQNWREVLLWHQVARVQAGTLPCKVGWEKTALLCGIGAGIGELWVQDGALLWMALGLASIAGYRLCERSRRSAGLSNALDADRVAIELAIQSGYPASVARRSLTEVLDWLCRQTPNARLRDRYRMRLQALQSSPLQSYASASPRR